jgi:hypothetical protein
MTEVTPQASPGSTFHLVYRSHSRIPAEGLKQELGRLFSDARSTNKRLGVTGALLCADDWFVQVLEGEEAAVQDLFDRIAGDARHDRVELLESGAVEQRAFSRWAMAKVAEDGDPDIALIAHRDGISPAAGRRTTSEQERVLDFMRSAARGGAQHV